MAMEGMVLVSVRAWLLGRAVVNLPTHCSKQQLANSSLSFTGGIAPMHMLVSMYYCIYMFSYGPYGPEIKHYYYYY